MAEVTLDSKLLKQVEYYFGDNNFPRDKFMKTECAKDDGWIKIETMLTFNRLKALVQDLPVEEQQKKIAEVLKGSSLVDVDEDGTKLRRNQDVPLDPNTEARTVYLKGFPKTETKLDDLFEFFNQYDGVEAVVMRWYKEKTFQTAGSTNGTEKTEEVAAKEPEEAGGEGVVVWVKKFKGSILVVFKTVELATKFLQETNIVFKGNKIDLKMFHTEYKKLKREEYVARVELRKKKAGGGSQDSGDANDKEANNESERKDAMVKGALVKLTNIPNTCSREDFKEKWYSATNEEEFKVIFVDFNKGATEGIVRLEKAGSAVEAVKILTDGKLKMGEDEECFINVTAMEGDDEQKYLDGITAKRMQMKRGNTGGHGGRGRGRGQGGKKRRY